MAFTLSNDSSVRYSRREQSLFALLPGAGRRVTSTELVKKFYGRRPQPFHSRKIVVGLMASLIAKVAHNNEPFRVFKSARTGPIPIEFWIEERNK